MQDEEWGARHERFPEHTPMNKEYYLLRSLFEERFPSAAALNTVPKGLSIACSTPEAVSWDPSWANVHDISGRAVAVHDASEGYEMAGSEAIGAPKTEDIGKSGASSVAAVNGQAKGAVSGAVVTMQGDAVSTSVSNNSVITNGVKTAPKRTVTPSALPQGCQLRTMHVAQPRVRARGHAMLSASKAARIGLRML
jgi:hypothetical protein